MKMNLLITALLLAAAVAKGQSTLNSEFTLILSHEKLVIKKGESDSVNVSVVRSKLYKRGKAVFGISSQDKKGLTAKIQAISSDSSILNISVSELAEPGEYFVIPNCTIYGKTKGTGIKVTIN